MLAKGNGNVENCINNLVHIFRGEVPFERAMGLNRAYIGKSSGINDSGDFYSVDAWQLVEDILKNDFSNVKSIKVFATIMENWV